MTRARLETWPCHFKGKKKKRKIKLPSEQLLYLHTLRLIKSYASEYMFDYLVCLEALPLICHSTLSCRKNRVHVGSRIFFIFFSVTTETFKISGSAEKCSAQNSSISTERLGSLQVSICIRK